MGITIIIYEWNTIYICKELHFYPPAQIYYVTHVRGFIIHTGCDCAAVLSSFCMLNKHNRIEKNILTL